MDAVMVMPSDDQWTVDDLDALPDDGLQYELFDGVLVVSPVPTPQHQRVVLACARALFAACPAELEVFVAPLDFRPTRRRSLQPDVLVARRDCIGAKNLTVPPVLAVEVLSEGTRAKDLVFKRAMYQSSGVASYWVIDPDARTLDAFELVGGGYQLAAHAAGDQVVELSRPFPVSLCPAALVAGR